MCYIDSTITCLYSHRCKDPDIHELGRRIETALSKFDIRLGVDNLCMGDQVRFWVMSVEFECVIFVASELSWGTKYCQLELETADFRSAPIFVLRIQGKIPEAFQERLRLEPEALSESRFIEEMEKLALAIRERVTFVRRIRSIRSVRDPIESADAAREIRVTTRPAILAEHVKLLASEFQGSRNDQYRYWFAHALGRAGTPEARRILTKLQEFSVGPFARLGIAEAIEDFQEKL